MAKLKKKKPTPKKASKKSVPRKAPAHKKKSSKPAKKPVAHKPAAKVTKPSPKPKRPAGFPEKLRDAALKILDERQAEDVITVDLADRSSVADYMIIASGRASRQIAAIAHYLRESFGELGVGQTRVEGLPEANWVLVDGGDVVVHLFRPEVRRYYDLEHIWDRQKK